MATVKVHAQGHLRHFRPHGLGHFSVDLPSGSTVLDLIRTSGVPGEEIGLVSVNGLKVQDSTVLADGDDVMFLAPLEGG